MYLLNSEGEGTPDPFFMEIPRCYTLYPDVAGARYLHKQGFAEKTVLKWVLDTFIQPDKAFLDIGAHVGTYSWTCAQKATHVYAFECSPRTFCYLAANIALKGHEYKITPFPYALGNREGTATYYVRSEEGGDNGIHPLSGADQCCAQVQVPVRTLDSFKDQLQNIGFIKMDVEGHEKEVLEGGVEVLRQNGWPKILFECWEKHANPEVRVQDLRAGLFSFLESIGYTWVPIRGVPDMYIAEHP